MLPLENSQCFFELGKDTLTVWQQTQHSSTKKGWSYRVKSLPSDAFSCDIDFDGGSIAVAFADGCLNRYDLNTLELREPSMQLFPKGISMEPKSIRVYKATTFGLVFKTGTVVICRQSVRGEIMIVARLFQSSEALKLVDPKANGIELPHQQIEFLEAADDTSVRALILSTHDQIDLIAMRLNQDVVEKQVC